MGVFANTLFQALLGWVKTIGSVLWNGITDPESQSLLGWIGKNWLGIAVVLCLVGVVTDFIVYLFRWQPYRVWRRFFGGIFHRESSGETSRREEYIGGADEEQEAYQGTETEPEAIRNHGVAADESRFFIRNEEEEIPVQRSWKYTTAPEETDEEYTARIEQAIKPRRRRRSVRQMLGEDQPERSYAAPQDLIDRREAYRRPVYPQNWKGNDDRES